jgi:hypothetical protein
VSNKAHFVGHVAAKLLVLVAVLGGALVLAGCGGGGGGQQDSGVSANFSVATLSATTIEGQGFPASASATVTVNVKGSRDVYVGLTEDEGLLRNYSIDISSSPYKLEAVFKTDRPAGTYTSRLKLLACFDRECREPAPGSPLVLPVQLTVTPNLQVQPTLLLSRTGLEPAPSAKVKVTVPPGAGTLQIASGDSGDSLFKLSLVGDELTVTTGQPRAGRYVRRVEFQATGGAVYRAAIDIEYLVNPPPDGERALALLRSNPGNFVVKQGDVFREVFRVQRPTWVVDNAQPRLEDPSGRFRLRDLGADSYEVSIDTAGLPIDTRASARVWLSGLISGSGDSFDSYVVVEPAFVVRGYPGVTLDGASTTTLVRLSTPVSSTTGTAMRWTARSLTPWVSLVRSSGVTDLDEAEVVLDLTDLVAQGSTANGEIEISVDRPNTSPVRLSVGARNAIPRIGPALRGPLLAGQTSLYVDGFLTTPFEVTACLQVSGATLRATAFPEDTRYVGAVRVLRLTLADVVQGQDLVLRCTTPLLTTIVRVPVRAAPRVLAGYATLPLNNWRPAQFSLAHGAAFFAGDGVVARWAQPAQVGGAWVLTSRQVPGLVDAALYGDHSYLIGVGQDQGWRLDATGLDITASTRFVIDRSNSPLTIDPQPLPATAALAFAADGAAYMAIRLGQGFGDPLGGVFTAGGSLRPLTGSFANYNDPGSDNGIESVSAAGSQSSGVVRSPGGSWVVGQAPSGRLRVHEAAVRRPVGAEQLPVGVSLRAVSEDGQRRLRSDGVLQVSGSPVGGSLASRLPTGFVVGGYGLTGSGRYALVYGYRIASEPAGPRARDAAVWLFDLSDAASQGIASAPLLDRLALPDAVGCTTALQTGESCEHVASVTVAEGDQSAFVLGPRGVAALPLPLALLAANSAAKPSATRQPIKMSGAVRGSGSR